MRLVVFVSEVPIRRQTSFSIVDLVKEFVRESKCISCVFGAFSTFLKYYQVCVSNNGCVCVCVCVTFTFLHKLLKG